MSKAGYYISGSGGGSVRQLKRTLSSAEVLTLNSNPITLLAAPGVGTAYDVFSVLARMNFSGAAYTTNTNLRVKYSTSTSQVIANSSVILTQTTSARWGRMGNAAFASGSIQYAENDSVIVDVATGNPTAGGGTVDIFIAYMILAL